MTTPSTRQSPNDNLVVDNSILETVAMCSTKAVTLHILGLTSKKEKAAAFAGKCAHSALHHHFLGKSLDIALTVFKNLYHDFSADQLVEERLAYANLTTILEEWMKHNPPEKFPFVPVIEDAEKGLRVALVEGIDFFALVDLPVRDKDTGAISPLDHKTTGKITSWWTKKFGLGSQLTGYIWTCGQYYGEVCARAYVNAIEFGKLPDSSRKCSKHGMKYIECRHLHAKWEMLVTSRSHEQLVEWHNTAVWLAGKFRDLQKFGMLEMLPFVRMQGYPFYVFDYLWGERSVGFMSDEVNPEAVSKHESGFDIIDLNKIKPLEG